MTAKISQYVLVWMVYAFLQAFVLRGLVDLPFWILLIDGAIHGVVFGVIGILLWNVLKFGKFGSFLVYQRMVNYIALGLMSITCWLSVGYGMFYLLFGNVMALQLFPVLPIRCLTGLLIYLLILQQFSISEIKMDQMNDALAPLNIKEGIIQKNEVQTDLLERIAVKSGSKIHVILVSDILYLQADGDYVQIFTANGKYLKEQTMKYFEEHLTGNQFVRVHRSVIVNVEMISRIELYEKQNQLLTLKNGQQIKTSPGGYKALRIVLNL